MSHTPMRYRTLRAAVSVAAIIGLLAGPATSNVLAMSQDVAVSGLARTTPRRTAPVVRETTTAPRLVAGEVLVRFKERAMNLSTDAGRAAADAFALAHNAVVASVMPESNIAVLAVADGTERAAAQRFKALPEVLYAQPNYLHDPRTNDARFPELWALENSGQDVNGTIGSVDADLDAPEAWVRGEGAGAIVAVIDSGVAYEHPDLRDNMWDGSSCVDEGNNPIEGGCLHGFDFENTGRNRDANPTPESSEHGTHVAGTIAAVGENDLGIVGVAPKATIMALKTALTTDEIINAILFAERNGATIINASFGGATEDLLVKEAMEGFDGIIIASAGNNGADHGDQPSYPCDYDLPNIVCVAATDQNDALADFSDYGSTLVDVAAPGVNILSTVPGTTTPLNEDFSGAVPPGIPETFTTGAFARVNEWGTNDFGDGEFDVVLYGDINNRPYAPSSVAGSEAWVETNPVNLSGASGATVSWWTGCDTESGDINLNIDLDGMFLYAVDGEGMGSELARWNETTIDGDGDPDNGAPVTLLSAQLPSAALVDGTRLRFAWRTNDNDDTGTTGDGCWIDQVQLTAFDDGSSEQYAFADGTSMAAPHVSGIAALLRAFNGNLTIAQTKDLILSTGDAIAALDGVTVSGRRVNAANALAAFDPHVGLDDDEEISVGAQSEQFIKFNFQVRDGLAGLPFTLQDFAYSVDGGETWTTPETTDSLASFALDGRTTLTAFNSDPGVESFTLLWDTAHPSLEGLAGVDQDDILIRFAANDGAVTSPLATAGPFSKDNAAPTALVLTGPDAVTQATSATITVGGDDMIRYFYWVDGDVENGVTVDSVATPIELTGLAEGDHVVKIRGIDDVGNWQAGDASTSVAWTIDLTPGTATGATTAASGSPLTAPEAGYSPSASMNITVGGEGVVVYRYALDSTTYGDEAPVEQPVTLAGLADGDHTVRIIGRDAAGNWQGESDATLVTWTVDTVAPTVTLDNRFSSTGITGSTSTTIDVAGDGVTKYRFAHTANDVTSALSDAIAVNTPIELAGLGEGAHAVSVIGRDAAGNWQAEANATMYEWTVDLTAPTATETTAVATPTNDSTPTIGVTIENGAGWDIWYTPPGSKGIILASGTGTGAEQIVALSALTDGIYALTLTAFDHAKNSTTIALSEFVVDTTSPSLLTLSGTPENPTARTEANITVGGDGVVAYRYAFDGGAYGAEANVATTIALTGLTDGSHTLRVIGKDGAGNWTNDDGATVFTWMVDTTPITPPTASPASGTTFTGSLAVTFRQPAANLLRYAFDDATLACDRGSSLPAAGGELVLTATSTVRIIACDGGMPSAEASFTYTRSGGGGGSSGGGGGGGAVSIHSGTASAPIAVVTPTATPTVTPQVLGVRLVAEGTLVRVARRDIYLFERGVLRRIPDLRTLARYATRPRIEVGRDIFDEFRIGNVVGKGDDVVRAVLGTKVYAEGTLLRLDRRAVYVVRNSVPTRIHDPRELRQYPGRRFTELSSA